MVDENSESLKNAMQNKLPNKEIYKGIKLLYGDAYDANDKKR